MISWDQLGIKPGIGSARSVGRLNLHQALAACGQHLLSHGGHAAAAGLKIEESKLDAFRADFCEYVAGEMSHEDRIAEVQIDAEATLSQLTLKTVEQIEQLAPFGNGNPRPILCASGVTLGRATAADGQRRAAPGGPRPATRRDGPRRGFWTGRSGGRTGEPRRRRWTSLSGP